MTISAVEPEDKRLQDDLLFADRVNALGERADGCSALLALLREDHVVYAGRGAATTVRMRGWVLLALGRHGLPDEALPYVLEELETGTDPYLVAAAAHTLRSYAEPHPAFAPFLVRALTNIRGHDEWVCFDVYGAYAASTDGSTALGEVMLTLEWMGPHARDAREHVVQLLERRSGLSSTLSAAIHQTLTAIATDAPDPAFDGCCSVPRALRSAKNRILDADRAVGNGIQCTIFEDQQGSTITYREFFVGRPSVVVFFYTRCDNPLKCSLTVTKLGRIQQSLRAMGLGKRIRTAAITYDPGYDLPARLDRYGRRRGVQPDQHHRLLRAPQGIEPLQSYFRLGVGFTGSLVNRHRLEVFVLDSRGRVAATFERLLWDEQQVIACAVEVLNEKGVGSQRTRRVIGAPTTSVLGGIASIAVAFFPKCAMCWASYMSVLGIAGLHQVPYAPWVLPVLSLVMLINLGGVGGRARATGRVLPFFLVAAGAVLILAASLWDAAPHAARWGVALSLLGSAWSILPVRSPRQREMAKFLSGRGLRNREH